MTTNVARKPNVVAAAAPAIGPAALPSAVAVVVSPNTHPRWADGVRRATIAMVPGIRPPVNSPSSPRQASSSYGLVTSA